MVEKKIFRQILEMDSERVEIPVRVKFEFEVVEGAFVPDTLTREILYNHDAIQKRYPKIKLSSLNHAIDEMVEDEIMTYMRRSGFFHDESTPAT